MRQNLFRQRKHKLWENQIVFYFYDIYVLNELYFRLAGGDENYGYIRSRFVSFRAEEKIRRLYEKMVEELFEAVTDALERSVRYEIRHVKNRPFNKRYLPREYLPAFPKINKKHWSLEDIARAYHLEVLWPDRDYGGKKWGIATDTLIQAKKAKSIKDKFFYIDRIFDLQHNNGFILDKTEFECLDIREEDDDDWRSHFDIRAKLKKIQDFEPYVSLSVKKLMIPNYNKL